MKNKSSCSKSLMNDAHDFIDLVYTELGKSQSEITYRKDEVASEIELTGTYKHTYEELEYGCKLAWRNNLHCIGKLYWNMLKVFDKRHLVTEKDIFDAIVNHCAYATNKGQIISTVTIFSQKTDDATEIRIWNPQIIRYAGYKQEDGTIIGDPEHVEITEEILKLGWVSNKNKHGMFDVLPIVIQIGNNKPQFFDLPKEVILDVPIVHPRNKNLSKLGLKWHALPAITNMYFNIGGIIYTAAPFNGWYMNTEIVQNFGNHNRYNLLPQIATVLDIPMISEEKGLWQDIAYAELSLAIYHSYKKAGVKMVDHHTASKKFAHYVNTETRHGRIVPAKISWVLPPSASSLLDVYHMRLYPKLLKPTIGYNSNAWNRNVTILPRGEILDSEINVEDNNDVKRCPFLSCNKTKDNKTKDNKNMSNFNYTFIKVSLLFVGLFFVATPLTYYLIKERK